MCLNPKWIYKRGRYKSNNYRGTEGSPYEIGTYSKCGACEQCINERCNSWVVRNWYEQRAHKKKCFITLTYEDNPYFLVRKDGQDFMKRFRRKLETEYQRNWKKNIKLYLEGKIKTAKEFWEIQGEEPKVRMFQAGEYGTLHGRAHMHYIIYGWEDKDPKYLNVNKKGNLYYQSKLVQETWGLGRTSYQAFGDHEIPYLTLYETPQEYFKKAYKLTLDKCNKLRQLARNSMRHEEQYKNFIAELREYEEILKTEKSKYLAIKEYNSWSQGLGWEEFLKEYMKAEKYTWIEYIEGHEYYTPTSWVKRLANMGFVDAAQEMYRREEMIEQETTEFLEGMKNRRKYEGRRKKEILEWNDKKQMVEF